MGRDGWVALRLRPLVQPTYAPQPTTASRLNTLLLEKWLPPFMAAVVISVIWVLGGAVPAVLNATSSPLLRLSWMTSGGAFWVFAFAPITSLPREALCAPSWFACIQVARTAVTSRTSAYIQVDLGRMHTTSE